MKCRAVTRVLDHYLEGLLDEAERVEVEGHLDGCPRCRGEAEARQGAEEALRTLAVVEKAPDLAAELQRRMAAAPSRGARWALVVAAAAVLCVGAVLVWGQTRVKRSAPRDRTVTVATRPVPGPVGGRGGERSALTGRAGERPHAVVPEVKAAQAQTARRRRVADASHSVGRARPRRVWEPSPPGEPEGLSSPGGPASHRPPVEESPAIAALAQSPRAPAPEVGLILILGEPQATVPRSECHLEVALPDGTRSATSQVVEENAAGGSRVIQIAYESPVGAHRGAPLPLERR
jgi:anti-sigma factor RsiW